MLAIVVGCWAVSAAPAAAQSESYFTGAGVGALNTPRSYAVAAPLPDGDVLIAGGLDLGNPELSTAELYDTATETFTATTGSMTTARHSAVAAPLPDGNVLIAGGVNNSNTAASSAGLFVPAAEAQVSGGAFGDQAEDSRRRRSG
jgi:hypothetical protein